MKITLKDGPLDGHEIDMEPTGIHLEIPILLSHDHDPLTELSVNKIEVHAYEWDGSYIKMVSSSYPRFINP